MRRIFNFETRIARFTSDSAVLAATSCIALLALLLPPCAAAQTSASEAQVKAAFIINFARFVEWPNSSAAGNLRICVLSKNDPTLQELRRMAENKSIDGRSVQIRPVTGAADVPNCEMLFVPRSQQKESAELIHSSAPILTISEFGGFVEEGGMLNLVTDNDHVRLQVNPEAAQAVGLKISSRLLAIAQVVHTRK